MDAELYRRVAKLEKEVRVLLDLHVEAREQLRPRDAMAILDIKGVLGPGVPMVELEQEALRDLYRHGKR